MEPGSSSPRYRWISLPLITDLPFGELLEANRGRKSQNIPGKPLKCHCRCCVLAGLIVAARTPRDPAISAITSAGNSCRSVGQARVLSPCDTPSSSLRHCSTVSVETRWPSRSARDADLIRQVCGAAPPALASPTALPVLQAYTCPRTGPSGEVRGVCRQAHATRAWHPGRTAPACRTAAVFCGARRQAYPTDDGAGLPRPTTRCMTGGAADHGT